MTVRTVCWFSCGAASAIATCLTLRKRQVSIAYCETGAEHSDNARFMVDCELWFGQQVDRIHSEKYMDTWDVWFKRRYLAGVEGASCTVELKIVPRLAYQRPDDIHVFGYTCDAADMTRAQRFRDNYPELSVEFPLIDRGLTKAACLAMIKDAGIALPALYGLGFHNNNCLPCVKATSPAYWALVRKNFPDRFERMAALARELNVRLCRIDDKRAFIDEIPVDQETTNPIVPSCDFLCHIAETSIERKG